MVGPRKRTHPPDQLCSEALAPRFSFRLLASLDPYTSEIAQRRGTSLTRLRLTHFERIIETAALVEILSSVGHALEELAGLERAHLCVALRGHNRSCLRSGLRATASKARTHGVAEHRARHGARHRGAESAHQRRPGRWGWRRLRRWHVLRRWPCWRRCGHGACRTSRRSRSAAVPLTRSEAHRVCD